MYARKRIVIPFVCMYLLGECEW